MLVSYCNQTAKACANHPNGRNGSVIPVSGDYTATQINSNPVGSITATNVQTALQNLDTNKLASSALFGFTSAYLPLSGGTLSTPGNINISGTTILGNSLYLNQLLTTTASTSGYLQLDTQNKVFLNTTLTNHKTYTTSAIISATSYLLSATHNLNYQYVNVLMFDFTNNTEVLPDVKYNLSTNNVAVINIVNGNQFNANIIVQS